MDVQLMLRDPSNGCIWSIASAYYFSSVPSIDLGSKDLHETPLPVNTRGKDRKVCLGILHDSLWMYVYVEKEGWIDIWLLKADDSGGKDPWSKVYSIDFEKEPTASLVAWYKGVILLQLGGKGPQWREYLYTFDPTTNTTTECHHCVLLWTGLSVYVAQSKVTISSPNHL